MENGYTELFNILKLQCFNYGIILIFGIVAIVIYVILLKEKKHVILLAISGICIVTTLILAFVELLPIYNDLKNQSFVELNDVALISETSAGFDWSGTREVSVETIDGNKLILKTTKQFDEGNFKGKIVYSQKSGYLLEWIQLEESMKS